MTPTRTPPIKLDSLRHLRDEMGRVYREAWAGKIDTQDATRLVFVLGELRKLYEVIELEQRIDALEGKS
ncbi:MAG: hypothetical protein IPN00_06990 [Hydrogenophilales bacterium]|nr:hypothetical protein [Hydrogenophilales bacterium]